MTGVGQGQKHHVAGLDRRLQIGTEAGGVVAALDRNSPGADRARASHGFFHCAPQQPGTGKLAPIPGEAGSEVVDGLRFARERHAAVLDFTQIERKQGEALCRFPEATPLQQDGGDIGGPVRSEPRALQKRTGADLQFAGAVAGAGSVAIRAHAVLPFFFGQNAMIRMPASAIIPATTLIASCVLLVWPVTQPMKVGLKMLPRLPIELMKAMPLAAATPPRNVDGTVQKIGKIARMPSVASESPATAMVRSCGKAALMA